MCAWATLTDAVVVVGDSGTIEVSELVFCELAWLLCLFNLIVVIPCLKLLNSFFIVFAILFNSSFITTDSFA